MSLELAGYLVGVGLLGFFYVEYKNAVESDLLFGLGILLYVAVLVVFVRFAARAIRSRRG